jgi:two-component system chemotaxis response regulator CheY
MKILIADDSRVMRQIVVRTLRQAGFGDHDLIEAADGKEAFDMATAE